jgi:hypothetical protein
MVLNTSHSHGKDGLLEGFLGTKKDRQGPCVRSTSEEHASAQKLAQCHGLRGFFIPLRLGILAFSLLPDIALAEAMTLTDVLEARQWVLEDAICSDVISLFSTSSDVADSIQNELSVGLLFASTLIQGVAMERGVSYGTLLVDWGNFCAANPETDWLDFQ